MDNVTPLHGPSIPDPYEIALVRRIDAGVAAQAVLDGRFSCPVNVNPDELGALVADGRAAHTELVLANSGLVWMIVNQAIARTGLDPVELGQEGFLGLLESIPRFQPERGRLASFALTWIRLRVGEAVATAFGSLGLSPKAARAWWRVRAVASRREATLGRPAHAAELAAECGRSEASVRELLAWDRTQPIADLLDSVEPSMSPHTSRVPELLAELTGEERMIVARRFGLANGTPATYAEVAQVVGLSEATVRRREQAALTRLRRSSAA